VGLPRETGWPRKTAAKQLENDVSKELNKSVNVVIYTRKGCHLCEVAHEMLREFGIAPTLIDIDADSALHERFDTCVPVVEIDGKIRFRGRVNRMLLRRIVRSQR
jgi:glutaredoxin